MNPIAIFRDETKNGPLWHPYEGLIFDSSSCYSIQRFQRVNKQYAKLNRKWIEVENKFFQLNFVAIFFMKQHVQQYLRLFK